MAQRYIVATISFHISLGSCNLRWDNMASNYGGVIACGSMSGIRQSRFSSLHMCFLKKLLITYDGNWSICAMRETAIQSCARVSHKMICKLHTSRTYVWKKVRQPCCSCPSVEAIYFKSVQIHVVSKAFKHYRQNDMTNINLLLSECEAVLMFMFCYITCQICWIMFTYRTHIYIYIVWIVSWNTFISSYRNIGSISSGQKP